MYWLIVVPNLPALTALLATREYTVIMGTVTENPARAWAVVDRPLQGALPFVPSRVMNDDYTSLWVIVTREARALAPVADQLHDRLPFLSRHSGTLFKNSLNWRPVTFP